MKFNRPGFKKQNKILTKDLSQSKGVSNEDMNPKVRQKLLARIAEKKESFRPVNIIGSKTTLYSFEDMVKLANEVYIDSSKITFDANNIRGTVNDPRMGGVITASSSTHAICTQCYQPNCPGHYGLIKFYPGGWIINPIFIKDVMKVLQCVCNSCSSLLCCETTLKKKRILEYNNEIRLKKIYEISKDIFYCKNKKEHTVYQCNDGTEIDIIKNCKVAPDFDSKNIQKEGVIKFYRRQENSEKKIPKTEGTLMAYTVEKVYSILNAISDHDAKILGFEEGSHPRNMVLKGILVIPELSRPPVYEGSSDKRMDQLTYKYATIVTKNENIGKEQNFKTIRNKGEYLYIDKSKNRKTGFKAKKEKKDELETMNDMVHQLYTAYLQLLLNTNDAKSGKATKTGAVKDYKSVFDRIQGKEAIMRALLMGKRNDYCARTVASPDASLKFGQVSLPEKWKSILTKPVRVNDLNMKHLENLLISGKIDFITTHSGEGRLEVRPENRYKLKLRVGDIVHRHGQDGDRHIINRQPSLHKYSIMSYEVVYGDRLTIGHHLSHTTPMNCDFDGDENNVWDPQNIEVEVECLEILNARKNVMSGQTNKPIMGLVMNSVTGSFLISNPKVRLSREFFENTISVITNDEYFDTLNARLEKYGVHPLSGQALYSCLLPDDFNYRKGSVIIREGILVNGQLTKGHVGVSDRSIIQELWKKYGYKRVTKFLTDAPRLINYWLKEYGFTVGIKDCINTSINPDTGFVEDKNELLMKKVMAQAYIDIDALDLNAKGTSKMIKDLKENKVAKIVNITETAGDQIVKELLSDDNAIKIMTEKGAGTKGALQNIVQIMCAVSQQNFQGKRFEFDMTDGTRCLPAFDPNATEPEARGFVKSSFFKGLNPEELFFIQAGCRENLSDTSLKTAITGRLEHLLIRSMENIKIANDGSVRNTIGYLFNPCYNCGYNPAEMVTIDDKQNDKLASFVDIKTLIDDLNTEAGWVPEDIYDLIQKKREDLKIELEQNPIVPIQFKSKNKTKKPNINLEESNRGYGNLPRKLSVYEVSRIIWTRAAQLERNAPPMIDVGDLIEPIKIAVKEFKLGILPIYIIRNMPDGSIERVYPTKENIDYSIL